MNNTRSICPVGGGGGLAETHDVSAAAYVGLKSSVHDAKILIIYEVQAIRHSCLRDHLCCGRRCLAVGLMVLDVFERVLQYSTLFLIEACRHTHTYVEKKRERAPVRGVDHLVRQRFT